MRLVESMVTNCFYPSIIHFTTQWIDEWISSSSSSSSSNTIINLCVYVWNLDGGLWLLKCALGVVWDLWRLVHFQPQCLIRRDPTTPWVRWKKSDPTGIHIHPKKINCTDWSPKTKENWRVGQVTVRLLLTWQQDNFESPRFGLICFFFLDVWCLHLQLLYFYRFYLCVMCAVCDAK